MRGPCAGESHLRQYNGLQGLRAHAGGRAAHSQTAPGLAHATRNLEGLHSAGCCIMGGVVPWHCCRRPSWHEQLATRLPKLSTQRAQVRCLPTSCSCRDLDLSSAACASVRAGRRLPGTEPRVRSSAVPGGGKAAKLLTGERGQDTVLLQAQGSCRKTGRGVQQQLLRCCEKKRQGGGVMCERPDRQHGEGEWQLRLTTACLCQREGQARVHLLAEWSG